MSLRESKRHYLNAWIGQDAECFSHAAVSRVGAPSGGRPGKRGRPRFAHRHLEGTTMSCRKPRAMPAEPRSASAPPNGSPRARRAMPWRRNGTSANALAHTGRRGEVVDRHRRAPLARPHKPRARRRTAAESGEVSTRVWAIPDTLVEFAGPTHWGSTQSAASREPSCQVAIVTLA